MPLSGSTQAQVFNYLYADKSSRLDRSSEKQSHTNCHLITATWISCRHLKLKIVQNLPKVILIESGRLFRGGGGRWYNL